MRHEAREWTLDGPGDFDEITTMVSKPGVPVSRYGWVIWIEVTEIALDTLHRVTRRNPHTMLRNIHPYHVLVESVPVCVEASHRISSPKVCPFMEALCCN